MLLGDIGEGSNALYCLTNRELCCSHEADNRGRWDFPRGGFVLGTTTNAIYSSKGFSSILLNRQSGAGGPTGNYTCLIPDAGNVLRNLRITIQECKL